MTKRSKTAQSGKLRIIGGSWRGRKLSIAPVAELRPTPDRIRETLFNWLAPYLPGANCLDLFAGTGALGLEALSRAAARATLVDSSPLVCKQLKEHLDLLKADNAQVSQGDVLKFLSTPPELSYDLIFLDPPYHSDLLTKCCAKLNQEAWLKPNSWVYVETAKGETFAEPANWRLHKEKTAGQVHSRLYQVST